MMFKYIPEIEEITLDDSSSDYVEEIYQVQGNLETARKEINFDQLPTGVQGIYQAQGNLESAKRELNFDQLPTSFQEIYQAQGSLQTDMRELNFYQLPTGVQEIYQAQGSLETAERELNFNQLPTGVQEIYQAPDSLETAVRELNFYQLPPGAQEIYQAHGSLETAVRELNFYQLPTDFQEIYHAQGSLETTERELNFDQSPTDVQEIYLAQGSYDTAKREIYFDQLPTGIQEIYHAEGSLETAERELNFDQLPTGVQGIYQAQGGLETAERELNFNQLSTGVEETNEAEDILEIAKKELNCEELPIDVQEALKELSKTLMATSVQNLNELNIPLLDEFQKDMFLFKDMEYNFEVESPKVKCPESPETITLDTSEEEEQEGEKEKNDHYVKQFERYSLSDDESNILDENKQLSEKSFSSETHVQAVPDEINLSKPNENISTEQPPLNLNEDLCYSWEQIKDRLVWRMHMPDPPIPDYLLYYISIPHVLPYIMRRMAFASTKSVLKSIKNTNIIRTLYWMAALTAMFGSFDASKFLKHAALRVVNKDLKFATLLYKIAMMRVLRKLVHDAYKKKEIIYRPIVDSRAQVPPVYLKKCPRRNRKICKVKPLWMHHLYRNRSLIKKPSRVTHNTDIRDLITKIAFSDPKNRYSKKVLYPEDIAKAIHIIDYEDDEDINCYDYQYLNTYLHREYLREDILQIKKNQETRFEQRLIEKKNRTLITFLKNKFYPAEDFY